MLLTIHIEPASVLVGILLTGCSLILKEVFSWVDIKSDKTEVDNEERFPIKYPEGSAFDDFCDAMEAINESETLEDINKAYIEVILFESFHPDSVAFSKDLRLAFTLREGHIKSHSL